MRPRKELREVAWKKLYVEVLFLVYERKSVKNILLISFEVKVEVKWRNDLFRIYSKNLLKLIVPFLLDNPILRRCLFIAA